VLREGFPTQATGVGVASPDGDTRRDLVRIAAPFEGDGEARKHALALCNGGYANGHGFANAVDYKTHGN